MTTLTRAQVLAHRWRAQGLDRRHTDVLAVDLPVLDLGVADVPTPAAATALAIRGAQAPDDTLALVWGARGAPALHRRASLQAVADALWPASDEDATRRVANSRMRQGAELGIASFRAVAEAVREVLTGADGLVSKAELSRGVSDRIPDDLNYDCPPCGARHVFGSVLQDAGLAGGAELVRVGRGTAFRLLPGLRTPTARAGFDALVRSYLHLLGPAAPADVAAYFGVAVAEVRSVWPDDVAGFVVAGRTVTALADDEASLRSRATARGVRLLPPGDPWLQARDRAFLVPKERHSAVWKSISPPGALLVDGEVVGTWRAGTKGRRLEVTVASFTDLSAHVLSALEDELPAVAAARGATGTRLLPLQVSDE
ncbi:DNA glycosylase AlkZ-like family protein [Kineococcus sp. SYSU DK003]|uniref:DNA glycosylase AlkZ-like family protein n=1 Tax=Kineococcus sp. SYSU DK003 TaxID=3383124 RepID=UPI003D7EB270